MSEGEVVEQLVEFTNILMAGVSLIFSVVSAYVVALNYFIGSANIWARLGGFLFISLVLGLLVMVLAGASTTHGGLIARLHELNDAGQLTAAGKAVLGNSAETMRGAVSGREYSIDSIVTLCVWGGLGFVYLALTYMTFLHKWTPDAIPVSIEQRTSR